MNRLIFLSVCLIVFDSAASGLKPLPPDVDAKFQVGTHAIIDCEGCHWEEPNRIPRGRIPTVCGDCHPGPQEDFQTSVHWDEGGAHAVCTDCHGIHGILPVADPQSVPYRSLVCGKCHTGPMEELTGGPHGQAFDRTGALVCASCHDNHAVQHPTIALLEPACETCHDRSSDAFSLGQRVSDEFKGLREQAATAYREIEDATALGYETKRAAQTIAAARGQFKQARFIWHSLNQERIDEQVDRTSLLFDRSFAQIQERISIQKTRETGIVVVWIVIFLAVLALHLKRKSLDTEG